MAASMIASTKLSVGGQKLMHSFCKSNSIPLKFFDANPSSSKSKEFTSPKLMKYLGSEYKIANQLYPAATNLRTRVDDYLDWHQSNLKFHSEQIVMRATRFEGSISRPMKLPLFGNDQLDENLDNLNNEWIQPDGFIAGKELTVADMIAATEIAGLEAVNYSFELYRPQIVKWLKNVEQAWPEYKEIKKAVAQDVENAQKEQFPDLD